MRLFGIEIGVSKNIVENNNMPENGQFMVLGKADRFPIVRRGGGMVRIPGEEVIIKKGGVNPDIYKGLIDL